MYFKGSSAFSENEVKSVERVIMSKKDEWDSFISLHSYGQLWLLPYSASQEKPLDYKDLYSKAEIGAKFLEQFNGQ